MSSCALVFSNVDAVRHDGKHNDYNNNKNLKQKTHPRSLLIFLEFLLTLLYQQLFLLFIGYVRSCAIGVAEILGGSEPRIKLKKLAILHDKGDYGKGFADLVKEYSEKAGIQVLLYEGVNPGAPDYSAVVNKIGNAGVDGVVWGGYHPEASKLVQQMKDKGMNLPFISDDGVKDNTFIEVAGRYAEGVYATGPTDTSANPMAIKAIADHKAKFGDEPGAFFLNAYAATQAIINAIQKAGSTDFAAVSKTLRSEYVETALGKISFDAKGDVIGFGFSVYQVQNGKYVELK